MKKVDKRLFVLLVFLAGINTASFSQSGNEPEKKYEFTIEGMTCGACAQTATNVLLKTEGIREAKVDFASKQAVVVASANMTEQQIRDAIKEHTNFEALFSADELVKSLTNEERKNLNIEVIKGGGQLNWKESVVPGKLTVFDFYADWCGPCKVFSPKVERLLLKYPDMALKQVDIVDWKSNLSKQLTKEYKMPALPFTLIFDGSGKFVGKVEGNRIEEVEQIILQYKK
ncbi:MAG TPA: thioredoxin domain-containing protein [Cyclobacteriaceae bacterium]|jgi:copper chaperone CopZ/thiol-disulfide isomerase/thioredoxin|nr:thioredoxin domain-containing protein [Cyclobacteriaceae bacterium]HRJ80917.1 thioredoxin domain-containing protein [Cyclobacteriaceae bacterium]